MSRLTNGVGGRRRRPPTRYAHLSEKQLIGLMAEDDLAALGELYDRLGTVAYGLALAIVRAYSLAEEAVEEGFLDLWRSAGHLADAADSGRTWLLVFVHRRAVARARDASYPRNGDWREVTPRGVSERLAQLPGTERDAIALSYFGARTRSEVAAIVGVTSETIGARMLSGLVRLRHSLSEPAPATADDGSVQ